MGVLLVQAAILHLALDQLGTVTQGVCSWGRVRHTMGGGAELRCLRAVALDPVAVLWFKQGAVQNGLADVYLRVQARALCPVAGTSMCSRGQHLAALVQVAFSYSLPVLQGAATQAALRLAHTLP